MDGKPFYKSKTFWFNVLCIALALAEAYGFEEYRSSNQELLALIVAIGNLFLRFITREPIR